MNHSKAEIWSPPDVGTPGAPAKLATAGGLADLQAEAYKEAFEQGLAEGREAGNREARAQVERLAAMFHDLAKPFEVLDAAVELLGCEEVVVGAVALAGPRRARCGGHGQLERSDALHETSDEGPLADPGGPGDDEDACHAGDPNGGNGGRPAPERTVAL